MTEKELVDQLTYASYAHNRSLAPNITPNEWKKVFGNVDAMEARYQTDLANDYADALIARAKIERHEGRADHDLTTRGEPMKAGR